MATVINNPPSGNAGNGGSGMGMVIGIVIVILIVVLLVLFGLPALRGGSSAPATDVPAGNSGDINVNLPDKIDVNVKPAQ